MPRYRILTLDGGGIRGLLTAIVLEKLDAAVPRWRDNVDLIAGTSTGGILALGLAHGLTPSRLRALYEKKGPRIFDDSWFDEVIDIGGLSGADYDNKNLRKELNAVFGQTKLKDLNKKVLIPAFDLDNEDPDKAKRTWKAKFFHNFPGKDSDGNELVIDVALYTSAAPTYFPSVNGFIDGGVVANNPSLAALAQTQDTRALASPPRLSDIALLSLGTGKTLSRIEGKSLDWGLGQWAKPIINILMDGLVGVPHYQCQQLLGGNYHRFSPDFPPGMNIPLDGVKQIPDLVKFAEAQKVDPIVQFINTVWSA
jgi:uncharacterized protein